MNATLEIDSELSYCTVMIDAGATPEPALSIGELAEQTGVSRRTVRFYVQRGLIDPPVGLGRASHYTPAHVDQIRRVLALQRGGLQLDDINALPEDVQEAAVTETPESSLVLRMTVAPGVRLELDAGVTPPTSEQLRELAEAARRILQK